MAVAAPAWGFLLALVVGVCIDPHEGAAAIAFAVTILWALTFGAAFALLAVLRGEKYRALGLVGLVVDLGPLLLAISKGQLHLQISSNVILLLGFSPSLLGLLVLLITCYFTHNRRLLGVACAVAVLLHGISAGLARQLYTWSAVGRSGATVGQGLLGELLIIGWAVIAVIALTKYALIEHAQIHR